MKLLYTCANRADDPLHWSGTVWNCHNALAAAGVELAVFDQIPFECPLGLRVYHQFHRRFSPKTHYLQIEPAVLRQAAWHITQRFARGDCDAVFCPGTGVPVHTYLPTSVPTFTYLDATKRSWIGTYFGLESLSDRSRRMVDETDRAGLHHNTLTFFSSDWAQAEAARDYAPPAGTTAVVPFGANLTEAPARTEVAAWIAARRRAPLRLLFLGQEWSRKGGPEALALVRALRARGLPATLDIVGCVPALDVEDRPLTRVHGFVDHHGPVGARLFRELLREAHILVFLSHAEAFGVALCEAAAYGVPAYASHVGGTPTIVRHGVTGWLGDIPFSPDHAAATLAAMWRSPDQYQRVALAARRDFETRLNWQVTGLSLKTQMEAALVGRAVPPRA
jgi:glycosyltransferase involved in cell wall biosynthesis